MADKKLNKGEMYRKIIQYANDVDMDTGRYEEAKKFRNLNALGSILFGSIAGITISNASNLEEIALSAITGAATALTGKQSYNEHVKSREYRSNKEESISRYNNFIKYVKDKTKEYKKEEQEKSVLKNS